MTMSEERKSRANWIIDKLLIGVSAFLVIASYNKVNESIERFATEISDLKTTTRVLEWRVANLEDK